MAIPARLTIWAAGDTLTASALNAEFNNLIVAITDGSADLTISSLTLATITASGTATFNGNTVLGNASSDTIRAYGIGYHGTYTPVWMNNLSIVRATTTNAGDSIKITGGEGSALSSTNVGRITLPSATTAGAQVDFTVTADVTILLTGAHWGAGGLGDLTGALLRVLALNDNGTLKWGVAYLGGRQTLLTTDTNATNANVNLPEEVLCNSAVGSASNTCREIGFVRADFDDTGGAAEDLWAIQSGVNDVVTGQSADGLPQPFNTTYTGFSADPVHINKIWFQHGRKIFVNMRINSTGTSNANTFKITLPSKVRYANDFIGAINIVNNTAAEPEVGLIQASADSATVDLFRTPSGTVWTNSGTKGASVDFGYEVGPAASFIS